LDRWEKNKLLLVNNSGERKNVYTKDTFLKEEPVGIADELHGRAAKTKKRNKIPLSLQSHNEMRKGREM
jgi:hypothetical protein